MRYKGTLSYWCERGFGFIVTEDRKEYFLHVSGIAEGCRVPEKGYIVEFDLGEPFKAGKLPQAVNAVVSAPARVQK